MSGQHDEHLAYGNDHGEEGERGLGSAVGGMMNRFRKLTTQDSNVQPEPQDPGQQSSGGLLGRVSTTMNQVGADLRSRVAGKGEIHSHVDETGQCSVGAHISGHRFDSFAPKRPGNDIKWYVDGCSYMWAVSRALERAKTSIWILDWWLSPELYLRRPPSKNEQYRVDRMLEAAAKRGVKVNIIVYKEVTQALTRKFISPTMPQYLQSLLPRTTDESVKALARISFDTACQGLEYVEDKFPLISPPVPVSSSHTKHHLEDLHENIAVFRHPDHLPDTQVLSSNFMDSLRNFKLTAANAAKLPGDALKGIYGVGGGTVLYWAHHEKLCLIDGCIAFMGGLDLCYGRWDTHQHPIADVHPSDVNRTVFPGQDYNNARIMDFQDVPNWEANKLDRTTSSRMGWSDVSLCLTGPAVEDLGTHFVERWNFIYDDKYTSRRDKRYHRLKTPPHGPLHHHLAHSDHPHLQAGLDKLGEHLRGRVEGGFEKAQGMDSGGQDGPPGSVPCQIMRSSAKWSHNINVEHSIANAYIHAIQTSEHFVYIENQFFITATSDKQKPIRNKIAKAIVERILRAARAGQKYKMFVVIPAVPAFPGDLRGDDALGTRAIMEFQYFSICRGGNSIFESIAREGFEPTDYIRFYNLRNYDRINGSGALKAAEQHSGVNYEDARKEHDKVHEGGGQGKEHAPQYDQYQQHAQHAQGPMDRWDTVSECYMHGGEDIRKVPWTQGNMAEIDAFVSEELYVHSKLLIADDRIVICGSANLNDRSQLGYHDSEIAIFVEDPAPIDSHMDGRPWRASRFAASLRRKIFRKHLGLHYPQNMAQPNENYEPIGVGNFYDWGSPEDRAVVDPLSNEFVNVWYNRARTNTEAFERIFHPVPSDKVKNWKEYDQYYSRFFGVQEDKKTGKSLSEYKWGHVVRENFSQGDQGLHEVKELLSTIKGTLVEMPLLFLKDEDIAQEGLGLNAFTEDVYT